VECVILRGQQPEWFKNYGYGYGFGEGDGYGYGYGYGRGDGSGDGYGNGDGYGYGDGYGSGSGDGSGDGYGNGDGSGDGSYWLNTIRYFAEKWSDAQRARLDELRALGAKICFWRSQADGTPANGGRLAPAKIGDVHKVNGPLELCTKRALHATLIPPKWKGERVWVVALLGEVIGDEEKYGALEREIIGECLQCISGDNDGR
jgi:hypothetical protein